MKWQQYKKMASGTLLVVGIAASIGSFFVYGQIAWLLRMGGLMLVVAGVQWLPAVETWLKTHEIERLAIATMTGLMLVWMLMQYSFV